jgi:nicotinamide riboside kinase
MSELPPPPISSFSFKTDFAFPTVTVRASMSFKSSADPKPACIYVIGAQCTGKTTLVNALQLYFDKPEHSNWHGSNISAPGIIKEVARNVLKEHNFTAEDITSSRTRALSLQKLILEAQLTAERRIKPDWFISDRSGIDPLIYAKRYVGEGAAKGLFESAEWLELRESMRQSSIVVCEPGSRWLSEDGVRLMPENEDQWMAFHHTFCAFLEEMDIKYRVLPNSTADLGDRVEFVIQYWRDEAGVNLLNLVD